MDKKKVIGYIGACAAVLAAGLLASPLAVPLVQWPFMKVLPDFRAFQNVVAGGLEWTEYWNLVVSTCSDRLLFPYLVMWLAIAAALAALGSAYYRIKHPRRDVENGVLGKQRAVTSPSQILKLNSAWNGEEVPVDGVVLGSIRNKSVVVACIHAAICAPSGAGKTRGSVYPTIDVLSYTGKNNLLVTDPSLEILITAQKALRERKYKVMLLDFDNPRQGLRFNPLKLISDLFKAGDTAAAEARARETGAILFPTQGNENDIFVNAAAGVFNAVAYIVATSPEVPGTLRHLWSVVNTLLEGTVGGTASLKDWLRSFGSGSPVVSMAATFLSSEGKLESSIMASLHDGLQPYTSINMRWLLSASEIDIDTVINDQTAVFIHTLGPGSPTNRIAALFFAQHWAEVQRLGKRRDMRPCWVIGDEWHSVPRFDLVHAIENARKYGLHYVMYTQSFSGYDQYKTSKEDGKDAILANCDVKALYRAGSDLDARYFEALSGKKTVHARNTGQSSGGGHANSSEGFTERDVPVWPMGDILERNPFNDGVLVVRSASGNEPAGKFEVPMRDASSTFTAKHFGTLGSREFERHVMASALDNLESRAAAKAIAVSAWTPDFNATKSDTTCSAEVVVDEFAAWD